MPGPPLAATFTYDGTPGSAKAGVKFTALDRSMVQTQRFFISPDTGTHARETLATNIPRNSDKGKGGGSKQFTANIDQS
jgi:hypothetical protein